MTDSFRNIRLFYILNFFGDFVLIAPVAAIYYASVSGSYAAGMSIFSINMLSAAIFEVPTGMLSDKIGRRLMLILGSSAGLCAAILLLIGQNYVFLVLSAIMFGLGRAFHSGNNDALLYDSLMENDKVDQYPSLLGKTGSAGQLALAISAVLGGLLANISFTLLLWLSLIPAVILVIVSFLFHEPQSRVSNEADSPYASLKEAIVLFVQNPRLRLLSIAGIVGHAFSEASFQFSSVFVGSVWPIWALGIGRFLSNIGASVSFYYSGRLINKCGDFPLLIAGNLYARLSSFFALIQPTVLSPLLISSNSLFYGVNTVSKNHLMQREFSDNQRATMSSLQSLASSVAFAIISIFLGWLADQIGIAQSLFVAQLFLLSLVFIYWRLYKK